LDDVAFAGLNTNNSGGASARQHLLARRCPQCRAEILGAAFNVLPLKDVANILIAAKWISIATDTVPADPFALIPAENGNSEYKVVQYEVQTSEMKHIHALQLGCYAQSQLAQHSVIGVLAIVNRNQWLAGVYILFESAVSRVFFETFATTLHGKGGGLHVLVNAAQRMLAVQLVESKASPKPELKEEGHLLIKVATDGRFTITKAPTPKAATNAAVSIQVEESASNARSAALATSVANLPLNASGADMKAPVVSSIHSFSGAASGLSTNFGTSLPTSAAAASTANPPSTNVATLHPTSLANLPLIPPPGH
jgi:hypothetical protein